MQNKDLEQKILNLKAEIYKIYIKKLTPKLNLIEQERLQILETDNLFCYRFWIFTILGILYSIAMLLYQFFTNLTTYGFSNNSSIKQLELILLLIIILVMFIIYIISAIPSLKPKTKLEDVDFEKEFETHTTNEIECRYLLTPAFIERFNNIKMTFSARNISCSFYKNKVYLAIPT